MGEIRVVVADDELLARRGIRQLLDVHGDARIVGEAADGREAIAVVEALRPDLLILDIQMPELDGFSVLRSPAVADVPALVFLTAYAQFAPRAFDVDAVDYLLKPVRAERLNVCMERVRARLAMSRVGVPRPPAATAFKSVLLVPVRHGQRLIHPEEVDWIEASDYYATLHTSGRTFMIRESLTNLEERLPPGLFLRVHRSALVNAARIGEIVDRDGHMEVVLRGGTRIPVSRRRRRLLADYLRKRGSPTALDP